MTDRVPLLGEGIVLAIALVYGSLLVVLGLGGYLLSVGLHSHGFTESAARDPLLFCSLEFLYAGVATLRIRTRRPQPVSTVPE